MRRDGEVLTYFVYKHFHPPRIGGSAVLPDVITTEENYPLKETMLLPAMAV